jgi:hypothetical protein
MRAKPRSEQQPKAFQRVDMPLMHAIAIVVPRLFAAAMTHTGMLVAPRLQTAIDVVLIRVPTRAGGTRRLDQRVARCLLDVGPHPQHHVTTALDPPKDRGLRCCERTPSTLALEPSPPSPSPFFMPGSGLPLWPATMETSAHATASLQGGGGFVVTMPCRHWPGIWWTSAGLRSSAWALCWCDKLSPIT